MTPAVLFDLDGLLIDSERRGREVERRIAGRLGITYTNHDWHELTGLGVRQTAEYLHARAVAAANGRPPPGARAIAGWYVAETKAMIREQGTRGGRLYGVRAMPGAHTLLMAVRDAGLPAGLVTAADRQIVWAVLGRIGWRFDVIVDAQCPVDPKPSPDPWLYAVKMLQERIPGLDPADCWALDDSPAGVAFAEAAGCRVIAVPRPGGPRVDPAGGTVVIRTLDQLAATPAGLAVVRP